MTEAFLMDNTPIKLFFDFGASRSYLSKKYYDANKSLHKLPKFSTTCTGIKIGNGSTIPILFVIPIQFMTHGHVFEIYTIVAEINDGMDLVFGFKNMAETEGRLNTRTGEYDFIGRSIPVYPQNNLDVPVGKQVLIKIKAPFGEKLSGRIMTKMFGSEKSFTMKIRIENNQGCVQFVNKGHETIKLTEKSKEYCGILPYFGSPIYRYEVLPMSIACAPQIWMDYITLIMAELEQKNKYIAIMDDLLLHSTKVAHWKLLEQLFQSMCENGLKLSPKKCQLFRTELTYMSNEFVINKRTMTITPLRSRTEAISKIPTPKTAKQCKSFC